MGMPVHRHTETGGVRKDADTVAHERRQELQGAIETLIRDVADLILFYTIVKGTPQITDANYIAFRHASRRIAELYEPMVLGYREIERLFTEVERDESPHAKLLREQQDGLAKKMLACLYGFTRINVHITHVWVERVETVIRNIAEMHARKEQPTPLATDVGIPQGLRARLEQTLNIHENAITQIVMLRNNNGATHTRETIFQRDEDAREGIRGAIDRLLQIIPDIPVFDEPADDPEAIQHAAIEAVDAIIQPPQPTRSAVLPSGRRDARINLFYDEHGATKE